MTQKEYKDIYSSLGDNTFKYFALLDTQSRQQ